MISIASTTAGFVDKVVVTGYQNLDWAMGNGWLHPRRGSYHPVRGAVVPAHGSLQIVVRLVPPRDGRFVAGPVTIDYHVGGHHYRTVEHSYGVVCAPRHSFHNCAIPDWVVRPKPASGS